MNVNMVAAVNAHQGSQLQHLGFRAPPEPKTAPAWRVKWPVAS